MTTTNPTITASSSHDARSVEAAFALAWAACHNPDLDGTNPHFRNRFASLKATLKTIRAACAPYGLSYMQHVKHTPGGDTFIESTLYTTGGQCLVLSQMLIDRPSNPQAFGSNMTYAKRQLAQADWGITGEEDDDAEAAARHATTNHAEAEAVAVGVGDVSACVDLNVLRQWWNTYPQLQDAIQNRVAQLKGGKDAQ